MSHGTVTLPSRTFPAVHGRRTPGLPNALPGGIAGPAPLPSRATTVVAPPAPGFVPGGNNGTVRLFEPSVDKTAPYFLGGNEGFSIRSVDGSPLAWFRRFFANEAAVEGFIPSNPATPNWSSNSVQEAATSPGVPIPVSNKPIRWGALRRAAFQDEQLFTQITGRGRPWPIQKPVPFHLRAAVRGQPMMTRPYPYKLTRYTPAASYSQTTLTLLSGALKNLLPSQFAGSTNPPRAGGTPYGSY